MEPNTYRIIETTSEGMEHYRDCAEEGRALVLAIQACNLSERESLFRVEFQYSEEDEPDVLYRVTRISPGTVQVEHC